MQSYLVFCGLILLFVMLLTRVAMLRKKGIKALIMEGSDYFIAPIFFVVAYEITASAWGWPLPFGAVLNAFFFQLSFVRWAGVFLCGIGLIGFLVCLKSFGDSFRVGIDNTNADKLVTTGMFGISRNPIYLSFLTFFLGIFCVFTNLIFLLIFAFAVLLIHRQIRKEEKFMMSHYGNAYLEYCKKVRRYL